MGIITAILSGAYALGAIVHSGNKQRNRVNNTINAMVADGYSRVSNHELEEKYHSEYILLWARSIREENPDLFYPEKHAFFRSDPGAALVWAWSEAEERIIREGFAPERCDMSFSLQNDGGHSLYRITGWEDKERTYNFYISQESPFDFDQD